MSDSSKEGRNFSQISRNRCWLSDNLRLRSCIKLFASSQVLTHTLISDDIARSKFLVAFRSTAMLSCLRVSWIFAGAQGPPACCFVDFQIDEKTFFSKNQTFENKKRAYRNLKYFLADGVEKNIPSFLKSGHQRGLEYQLLVMQWKRRRFLELNDGLSLGPTDVDF